MRTQWLSVWALQCGCVWWGGGEGSWAVLSPAWAAVAWSGQWCGVRAPATWNSCPGLEEFQTKRSREIVRNESGLRFPKG